MYNSSMRIDRFISKFEGFSRNESRAVVRAGRVTVNGERVRDASLSVTESDDVRLDGREVKVFGLVYLMVNKPAGVVCSREGPRGGTVFELVREKFSRELSVAGRLDKDSTGLVLLSNDGQFIHNVISPRKSIEKEYLVETLERVDERQLRALSQGAYIGNGEFSKPKSVRVCEANKIVVVLTEGRYHEVKRLVRAVGNAVESLHRARIGGLELPETLTAGEWKFLDTASVKKVTGA